jgi:hypothetical protein
VDGVRATGRLEREILDELRDQFARLSISADAGTAPPAPAGPTPAEE